MDAPTDAAMQRNCSAIRVSCSAGNLVVQAELTSQVVIQAQTFISMDCRYSLLLGIDSASNTALQSQFPAKYLETDRQNRKKEFEYNEARIHRFSHPYFR
jgi:hypothetical protein